MLHPTVVSSVVLQAHWLWIYFPAPQLWEISVFFMTSQKKAVFSHTELSYMSKTALLPGDLQNKRLLLLCSNKFDSSAYFKSQNIYFFTQTNEKSLKPCSAGEKCFITDCKAAQLYIRGWWSGTWKQSENIYLLYWCSLNWNTSEVSQCRTVIRKAVISSSLTHKTINSRSLSEYSRISPSGSITQN